nr:hypothetical protein [Tanacetum cinerariifolium]
MHYGGICFQCKYDTNLNSLNFSDYPPTFQYETNVCELCGNDAYYCYDCPPQVSFVYNHNPCFDQNIDNNFPLTSPNFSQQNLVCENYGGSHATFQCQPMNQNFNYSNSFGFDQIQPPQQFVNHQPQEIPEVIPFIESKELIETKNELYKIMEAYVERMNQQRKQEALLAAQREQELRDQEQAAQREQELLAQKQAAQEKKKPPQNSDFRQLIREMCGIKASAEKKKKLEEMMLELLELCREKEFYCVHDNIKDLLGMAMNTMLISINLKSQRLDKEKHEVKNIMSSISNTPQISLVIAITPDLPTEEPEYSLSMGDEHLSTIPKIESDEVIKSSVKNLVPIPSESKFTSDNENTLIDSSPKFDYLLEVFSGELAHIDPIPPRIKEADFDLEKEIRLVDNLSYDNSFPRPLKELDAKIFDTILESLSLYLISSLRIMNVVVFFDFEPDTGVLTTKVLKRISEHYVLLLNILATLPTLDPDLNFTPSHDSIGSRNKIFKLGIFIEVQSERLLSREEFSISFIRDPLYPVFDTLLRFSSENEDKVFKLGILSYLLISHRDKITSDFFKSPMMMYGWDIPFLDFPYLHFYPP